ncbi:MAG: pyridoxamine 5'-phosphate oxidase [Waddliaceae bacterium]|nr:pyridoxamine 5'-phosphate oxidase [Waddliaceae bacterium]
MGKLYDEIDEKLKKYIENQQMFFVASAPLSEEGHVNVSPKGLDTFRIFGPNKVGYLDLHGSGIETFSHVRENKRLTFMFCSFEGPPRILRLQGEGQAIEPCDPEWDEWASFFPEMKGSRDIILMDVKRIADSCGYSVPLYEYKGQRDVLTKVFNKCDAEKFDAIRKKSNLESIDGLPGLSNTVAAETDYL